MFGEVHYRFGVRKTMFAGIMVENLYESLWNAIIWCDDAL